MKKTLTVNISGIVFHIDEDAYLVLNDYLQSLKKHFSSAEGRDEIISDIEARIAEKLNERIGDKKQVITIDDIEEVIKTIGMPEEFGDDFTDDGSEQFVNSGKKASKRLYRDPENSILGGVCGGLGAYLHTDPVWFRIAFVLLSIPGIGSPLLVYLILWIVIPEAKTAAERLEMRGEKVNVSNIEHSIKEEIKNVKNKFNDFARDARRTYKKKSAGYKQGIHNSGHAIEQILVVLARIVLIFVGFVMLVIGLAFLITIIAALIGYSSNMMYVDNELIFIPFTDIVNLFLGAAGNSSLFKIAFLLVILLPIVMLFYTGIRFVFGLSRTKYAGLTAFNVWIVALIVSTIFGYKVFKEFRYTGVDNVSSVSKNVQSEVLYISVNENDSFKQYNQFENYTEIDETNIVLTDNSDDLFYGRPQLEVIPSKNGEVKLEVYYYARGRSTGEAAKLASLTKYEYNFNDSILVLDRFFRLPENVSWRDQKVEVVAHIPEGMKIHFDEDIRYILNRYKHSSYRLAGNTWIMTRNGLEKTESVPAVFLNNKDAVNHEEPDRGSSVFTEKVSFVSVVMSQIIMF